jgi:hypothetical protein
MNEKGDLLVLALLAGVIIWWLFGPSVVATVTVPQAEVRIGRYKGPLESGPGDSPPALSPQDAVNVQTWLEDA